MIDQQQPKLFDSKTLMAIVIIGLFYVGWQQYLNSKYPSLNKKNAAAVESTESKVVDTSVEKSATAQVSDKPVAVEKAQNSEFQMVNKPAEFFTYEDEKVRFKVSSSGMSVTQYELKHYSDRKGKPITLTPADQGLFEMQWDSQKLTIPFSIKQPEPGVFVGTAKIGSIEIERKMTYHPGGYYFTQEVKFLNPQSLVAQFSFTSFDKVLVPESTSWLFPSYEHQDFLTFVGDKHELINTSRAKDDIKQTVKAINLYSLGTQYFTVGFLDKSEILPDLSILSEVNSKNIQHVISYQVPQSASFTFTNLLFIGPKSSEKLKAASEKFLGLMDYGMLEFISKPMLASMKWFFSIVGNWGFAIILLTLLVRAVVLPFNLMSYRSMKGMQKIQPLLTQIREKYKDDPVTLNKEMMSIMKNNNANPLAGCLPILLQIPIFFALYRVIGSSVELYQAPFGAWITDLSLHDKYYVLPVLMGITFYIQQKLTPTNMDPMQAKILAWMPVIFSLFMLNLPAGLTLYMVVSAVFGIVQQKTFMTLMKN